MNFFDMVFEVVKPVPFLIRLVTPRIKTSVQFRRWKEVFVLGKVVSIAIIGRSKSTARNGFGAAIYPAQMWAFMAGFVLSNRMSARNAG